jgi:hypothetical protein
MIENRTDEISLSMDVGIPSERNIIQEDGENKLKYKNVSI